MRSIPRIGLLLALHMATMTVLAADPAPWVIDPKASHIRFAARLFGSPIRGQFHRFEAEIRIDPNRLDESRVSVVVDPASIDTRNDERDAELIKENWFDTGSFPSARFESERIERDGNGYRTTGTLTIRDVSMRVSLPFEFETQPVAGGGVRGVLRGTTTLKRTEYGLGKGKWGKTSVVKDPVEVTVQVSGRIP